MCFFEARVKIVKVLVRPGSLEVRLVASVHSAG